MWETWALQTTINFCFARYLFKPGSLNIIMHTKKIHSTIATEMMRQASWKQCWCNECTQRKFCVLHFLINTKCCVTSRSILF